MAKYRSNLVANAIGGPEGLIRFDANYFITEDPEEISFLNGYGTQFGITITRVEDEADIPAPVVLSPQLSDIIALISECVNETELNTLIERVGTEYPEESVSEADKAMIISAIQEKRSSFDISVHSKSDKKTKGLQKNKT